MLPGHTPDEDLISLPPDPIDPVRDLDENPRYIILPDFRSSILPGTRSVYIYLPEAYVAEPTRRFPVFYLHDGQNLFDPRISFLPGHTWRLATTTDSLTAAGLISPVILVGIANTGDRRMAEYTPTRSPQLGGGEGPLYGRLLIKELKPLIDSAYRTLPDPANTGLGGSSLGGLISLALGLQNPSTFGKLAVMSPSIWWNARSILTLTDQLHPNPRPHIWLDMGTAEGTQHLHDCDELNTRLIQRGWNPHPGPEQTLHYLRVPGAAHNEDAWAARFHRVLRFLFPS